MTASSLSASSRARRPGLLVTAIRHQGAAPAHAAMLIGGMMLTAFGWSSPASPSPISAPRRSTSMREQRNDRLHSRCSDRLRRDPAPGAVAATRPASSLGLWHGFIFPLAWIVSLFAPNIAIYAVPNNGGWYDFGYFLGIVVFGVGARRRTDVARGR